MGAVQRLASVAVNDGIAAADEAMAEIQRPILRSADFRAAVASYRDSNRPGSHGQDISAHRGRAIGMTSSCPSQLTRCCRSLSPMF
jgi:hypothetical protein